MLGRAQPPKVQTYSKNPLFDLLPTAIRRLVNPKAPVKCCVASLQRNLAGYGLNGGKKLEMVVMTQHLYISDISKNQKIQLENLMKKVMGVAYMPEDLTGKGDKLNKSESLTVNIVHIKLTNTRKSNGPKEIYQSLKSKDNL